jgi:hypothetical protein
MYRVIVLRAIVLLVTGGWALAVIDEGWQDDGSYQYARDEIIVKFRKTAADAIEGQLGLKKSAPGLRLSRKLDDLAVKYRMKEIKPVFKDFKKHRQRMEALPKKDKRLLTKKEEHVLRRLERAPKGAKVPDLSKIYKIKIAGRGGSCLQRRSGRRIRRAKLHRLDRFDAERPALSYPVASAQYRPDVSGKRQL